MLASTRAGRCSKTSSYFVPALLYPSGCAFKFPHLLLFTLSSSRAGTLPKIHTCTHTHSCTDIHTHSVSSLCWWRSFTVVWSPHTQHSRGVFLSLPSFSFSTEQAKSRGNAGLWRVEAANFLWALWSLTAHPWRLNQRWSSEDIREQTSLAVLLWTRGQICIRVLLFLNTSSIKSCSSALGCDFWGWRENN